MSAYTKPILRYGLATPGLFTCVLLGFVLILSNKLQQIRTVKQTRHQQHLARLAAIQAMEAEVAPKRKAFENQKRVLQADPTQIFTRSADSIVSRFQRVELERTGMVFPLERGKIGRLVQLDIGRVKSSFEGGFGPMQETLLQVESLMPQALLEELKITRKADVLPNKPGHLVLETTHLCWKAPEAVQ
ncbi:MAG: hypothetical protein WCO60_03030 [Verrucomicrobiota bacterium]